MKNITKPYTIESNTCPLCQQQNKCDVNAKKGCWCMTNKVPEDLIEQIPTIFKNKACICQKCIDKFNNAIVL